MKTDNLQVALATGSGTLLGLIASIGAEDLLKSAVLAAVGASVSFAVGWLLQRASGGRRR